MSVKAYSNSGFEMPPATCEKCGTELYDGDYVYKYDGYLFCDYDCVLKYIGAKEVVVGEEE